MAYSSNTGLLRREFEDIMPRGFDNTSADSGLRRRTMAEEQSRRETARGELDHQDFVLSERQSLSEMADHYQRLQGRGADTYYDDSGQKKTINDLGMQIIQKKTFLDDFDSKLKNVQAQKAQQAKYGQEIKKEQTKKPFGETREGYMKGLNSAERQEIIKGAGKAKRPFGETREGYLEGLRSAERQEGIKAGGKARGNKGRITVLQNEHKSNLKILESWRKGEQNLAGAPAITEAMAELVQKRNDLILERIQSLESPAQTKTKAKEKTEQLGTSNWRNYR